jgi:parvulin-like peptidyl-prolyl isomerase
MTSNSRQLRIVRLFAMLGMLLGALSVAWSQDADTVLATVNGHEIRLSYVYRKVEALALGEQIDIRAQLERFVDSVIKEEILFQSMLRSDFQDEPDLREKVKTTVVEYLIQKYVQDRIQVPEDAIQAYYRDNASVIRGETVRVRHILRPQRAACEALLVQINSDATFIELAKTHSLDQASAPKGGDLGQFMRHPGPLGFEQQWFDMQQGEMRIFESPQGCHIIRLIERETPPMPPLEQVRERIRFVLARNQEIALLRALIEQRARDMNIERREVKRQ